ncbi:hypothetical protein Dimus_032627 [Dionaea muscipula]
MGSLDDSCFWAIAQGHGIHTGRPWPFVFCECPTTSSSHTAVNVYTVAVVCAAGLAAETNYTTPQPCGLCATAVASYMAVPLTLASSVIGLFSVKDGISLDFQVNRLKARRMLPQTHSEDLLPAEFGSLVIDNDGYSMEVDHEHITPSKAKGELPSSQPNAPNSPRIDSYLLQGTQKKVNEPCPSLIQQQPQVNNVSNNSSLKVEEMKRGPPSQMEILLKMQQQQQLKVNEPYPSLIQQQQQYKTFGQLHQGREPVGMKVPNCNRVIFSGTCTRVFFGPNNNVWEKVEDHRATSTALGKIGITAAESELLSTAESALLSTAESAAADITTD